MERASADQATRKREYRRILRHQRVGRSQSRWRHEIPGDAKRTVGGRHPSTRRSVAGHVGLPAGSAFTLLPNTPLKGLTKSGSRSSCRQTKHSHQCDCFPGVIRYRDVRIASPGTSCATRSRLITSGRDESVLERKGNRCGRFSISLPIDAKIYKPGTSLIVDGGYVATS